MKEKILQMVDAYWKFDNQQQPISSWHDKQDLLKALEELLQPAVMCCGYWEKFVGQKLETTDLIWFKNSGLAFVDSSLTTLEPDRFTSIPESWSFGGGCCVNQRSFGIHGVSHVKPNGWVYRDKDWGGDKWDKILYVCKVRKP